MKPMAKTLDYLGPILIIALMALITAEAHFRASFYWAFLILNFLIILVVWVGAILLLKTSFVFPRPKGFLWKVAAAWSLTAIVGWLINHLILAGFYAGSGGRPTLSIPMLILTWILGLVLVLGWLYGLTLLRMIFASAQLKWLKIGIEVVLSALGLVFLFVVGINLQVRHRFREHITSVDAVRGTRPAIVFGAGVYQESGRPSLVLKDRIETAARLVESGRSDSVLLSGDGSAGSLEVDAMERFAVEVGIPEELLLLDKAGFRTYETCTRAVTEFGFKEVFLVTQKFHLPRALIICDSVGLDAAGVSADQTRYSLLSHLIWTLRESLATAYAWLEIKYQG